MSRRNRTLFYVSVALAFLLVVAAITSVMVFRSDWFSGQIRERIISETEKATGGRVEIGSFDFDWRSMRAEVKNFVLHGKEKPGEPALFRAASVQVGLKVISALKKEVDIASGIVERPEFHLIVYPDGTNNLPSPKEHKSGNPIDTILKLKIRHYELRHGIVEFKEERLPLNVSGDNFSANLDYDVAAKLYRGHVSSRQLHVETTAILPLIGDFDTDLTLESKQIRFSKMRMAWKQSWVELSGVIQDWSAVRGEFAVRSNVSIAELGPVLHIPLEHRGDAAFNGNLRIAFKPKFVYSLAGKVNARNLAVRAGSVELNGISLRADAQVSQLGVLVPHFTATGLDGSFEGRASIPKFTTFEVDGQARGLALSQLSRFTASKPLPWSGDVSGPAQVSGEISSTGVSGLMLTAKMTIVQALGGIPIDGFVDISYDRRANLVRLGDSHLETAATQIDLSGTLGQTLQVSARSTNLEEIQPAIELFSTNPSGEFPVKLDREGAASASVTITGPIDDARVTGKILASHFSAAQQHIDRLSADVDVSRSEVSASNLTIDRGAARLTGNGSLALVDWRPAETSAIGGSFKVSGADVKTLLKEAGSTVDLSGVASASLQLQGAYGQPRANIQLTVARPAGFGEQFDSLQADLKYNGGSVEVPSGEIRFGQAKIDLSGAYTRRGSDWRSGHLQFKAASGGMRLEQIRRVQEYHKGLTGQVALKATGNAEIRKGDFDLDALDSEVAVRDLALDNSPVGNATATAKTRGKSLDVALNGNMRDSKITASGEWRLEGDYPGRGELQFSPVTFATLQSVAVAAGQSGELPFQGMVEGRAVVTGPLKKPDALTASIDLQRLEMMPNPNLRQRAGAKDQDLVLRNTAPVSLVATRKDITIRSASFTAKETKINASGRVALGEKSSWDLNLNGGMNLAILQLFQADLTGQGNAVLNASVTGPLNDPQVNGTLAVHNASLYLRDIATGVDNANGVVTFDRNRANIEKLTAEVGGGQVGFGGFVGFNAGVLIYRVQARVDQVRIRYPEGVSVTVNSALNLTGTSQNSLVSGTITVIRAGFTPKADLGSLLASSAKPISAPATPNEYLRNIQLDVRIESGPSLQFQTSLTRDLQAEADLRLRGNAARPALLGTISVNEGEATVFGTKYTINHGEIRFLNPTRIEPIFDIDLETKARAITVNISFSGTLNKLNLTYRSDPPLQSSEIIALLAVGRDPTTASSLASGQVTQNSFLESGSSVIGQALSSPVTSRLQRFFGVSRLKIDPQLTGVENIPQARLTLEQQVSRDITLTYITNLTHTQEQIVRVQWDLSKEWSAIAVRDESGLFGVDFQYRKRFK